MSSKLRSSPPVRSPSSVSVRRRPVTTLDIPAGSASVLAENGIHARAMDIVKKLCRRYSKISIRCRTSTRRTGRRSSAFEPSEFRRSSKARASQSSIPPLVGLGFAGYKAEKLRALAADTRDYNRETFRAQSCEAREGRRVHVSSLATFHCGSKTPVTRCQFGARLFSHIGRR